MTTLDLPAAAALLCVHEHTLEQWARAGKVPAAKPGKRWVFIEEDLIEWLRGESTGEASAGVASVPPRSVVRFRACVERGVYALVYRGEIVYIGKSTNILARLGAHARDKRFDEVLWSPIAEGDDLDEVERDLIRSLQPAYNEAHK